LFLWPEIHKWARKIRWANTGRDPYSDRTELLARALKLSTGEAFALASNQPQRIEGAHADRIFYLFDESKTIGDEIFDAAEGALSGEGEALALAVSTPGEPRGRFYEIHARKPGFEDWHTRHVRKAEVIAAHRMNPAWVAQRGRQWGEDSAIYLNRVEGEFASSEADGIIPLEWIERATERWLDWSHNRTGSHVATGADIARGGEASTVFALRANSANLRIITELRRYPYERDTMATAGRLAGILRERAGKAIVDVVGLGAGVVDQLRHLSRTGDLPTRAEIIAFNAGESPDEGATDRTGELLFANLRAQVWWRLREMLSPDSDVEIALPPNDDLIGDLAAPRWKATASGKILVESKDDLLRPERLGRSTDYGDAVVMAFYEGRPVRNRRMLAW
jgi:hypothetical protein